MVYNKAGSKRVTVDMPEDAYKQVEKIAEKTDRSISAMIRVLILEALEEKKK